MIWHQLQALSEVQDCTEVFLIGFWPEETFSVSLIVYIEFMKFVLIYSFRTSLKKLIKNSLSSL